jgi:hypothetical protein
MQIARENYMDQKDKKAQPPISIEEIAIHGLTLTEALSEILADKGELMGGSVVERIKKLKNETKAKLVRPN